MRRSVRGAFSAYRGGKRYCYFRMEFISIPNRFTLIYKPPRDIPSSSAACFILPPQCFSALRMLSASVENNMPFLGVFCCRTLERIFAGRISLSTYSPSLTILTIRSTMFSSSLMLPGQSYWTRSSNASGVKPFTSLFKLRAKW